MSPRALAVAVAFLLFVSLSASLAQQPRPAFVPSEVPVFAHPAPGHVRPPVHIVPSVTSTTPRGKTPSQMRTAYGFSSISNRGAGQTIAIIDAFDDPNVEKDLATFDTRFGLPSCTTANGCFT